MVEEEQFGPKEVEWDIDEEEKFFIDSSQDIRILDDRLRAIAVTSVRTKNLFLIYVGICVFAILTAATITDFQLLSGAAKIPLPIIKVEVRPLMLFYTGPFLVLGSYLYFLMYLAHLRRMVTNLNRLHPETEDWRIYPWVFNMRNWFARAVSFLVEFILPACVVWALWYRSLVLHDIGLSAVLAAMTILSLSHFTKFLFRMVHFTIPARIVGLLILGLLLLAAGVVSWRMPFLMDDGAVIGAVREPQAAFQGILFHPAKLALISSEKAGFIDTYLVGADFTGSKLPGAKFLGANMRGAKLIAANFEGSDFSRVPGKRPTDLSYANLTDANLKGANLRETILQGTILQGANLEGADLSWANLSGAILKEARLSGAQFHGSNLENTDLRGSDLEGAVMSGSDLRKASLDGANMANADLRWADLGEASLARANLEGANFHMAILIGTDLQGTLMDSTTIKPDGTEGPIEALPLKRPDHHH